MTRTGVRVRTPLNVVQRFGGGVTFFCLTPPPKLLNVFQLCEREVELSTARCVQVTFLSGPHCLRCVFDSPVTKMDPQALGKKRAHTCAWSTTAGNEASVGGEEVAQGSDGPIGAHRHQD